MKVVTLLLLVGAFHESGISDEPKATGETPNIAQEIRRPFAYIPPPADIDLEKTLSLKGSDTVVMMPFHVTDTKVQDLEEINRREKLAKQEEFKWNGGGTYYKHVGKVGTLELKVKFDNHVNLTDLINFSW